MKVYTRTGDRGTTSLVGGTRVAKDAARLEAYGTLDELNSWIGVVIASAAQQLTPEDATVLNRIQNDLFDVGTLLATEPESKWQPKDLDPSEVKALEDAIDRMEEVLPKHNSFILPAGIIGAANAQVARTVARRAERRMVTLAAEVAVSENAMRYVNRLSDYLFVLARYINFRAGVPETPWRAR